MFGLGFLKDAGKLATSVLRFVSRFPSNLVCIFKTVFFWIFYWVFLKVPGIQHLTVIAIYTIPYLLVVLAKLGIFVMLMLTMLVLMMLDVGFSTVTSSENSPTSIGKHIAALMTACNPDPRAWYRVSQYHRGNTHGRVPLIGMCAVPCPGSYRPALGGVLCRITNGRVPRYCPLATITRIYEGESPAGSLPDSAMSAEDRDTYREQCDTMEERDPRRALAIAVCRQAADRRPGSDGKSDYFTLKACQAAFCDSGGAGGEYAFCHRVAGRIMGERSPQRSSQWLKHVPSVVISAALTVLVARLYLAAVVDARRAAASQEMF
jgi:hypothetical protein